MLSAQRHFRFFALALSSVALALAPAVAFAQESLPAEAPLPAHSSYLVLQHLTAAEFSPADAALIRAKQTEISSEAVFFGYDLGDAGWDDELSVCPLIPGDLLLHYHRQFSNGAQSLFTAIVPRGAGRVFVVPILYRNATPFTSATGSERSIAVFNRIVPADVARQAIEPDGKWLTLGLCYADIAYGNANALNKPGAEVGLTRAPIPILRLSEEHTGRAVLFTDRNAPGEYLVWTLNFTNHGRLLAASALQLSDYVARVRHGAPLREKPLPQGKEPKVKPLPPEKEPTVKPLPQ